MKEATINWLKIAAKDLKLAEVSLSADEPLGVIFHLHAAVEKTLKAIYEEVNGDPPYIHDLKKLAIETVKDQLNDKDFRLLNLLNKAYTDSRYPKNLEEFEYEYNVQSCSELIIEIKELIKWLKSLIEKN